MLVHAPANAVAALVPPTVAVVTAASADSCLLTSGSDSLDGLAFHIAMLGFDFTVLDPPELTDRMHVLAARLQQAGQPSSVVLRTFRGASRHAGNHYRED